MTNRFLIYPLFILATLQLVPLLRRDIRWHIAPIVQLTVLIVLCLFALVQPGLVGVAWFFFSVFFVMPRVLMNGAERCRQREHWHRAAQWEDLVAFLTFSRLHRTYARALRVYDSAKAHRLLGELLELDLPRPARGLVLSWQLNRLIQRREWSRALDLYHATPDWGTAALTTNARLQIARAYAETGNLPRAIRCLQFVVLSPVVVRLEQPLWAIRVRLAAMAGDSRELEALLAQRSRWQRGFSRFAAYWRGRCALAAGVAPDATRHLMRALAITDPRDRGWRQAISYHLGLAGGPIQATPASGTPEYVAELAALHHADKQSRPWRQLMCFGAPTPVVSVLLALIAVVFAAERCLPAHLDYRFVLWAGNGAMTVQQHEWWRLVTTLFLHGGWLHLLMNGASLWLFGSAVERAWSWWRMLLVFYVAGAAGNLLSAFTSRYEIAVGASAGIFGLLAAYAVALWQIRTPLYAPLRTRMLRVLVVLVSVDFLIGWLEPQVDNLAHIGGFVAGLVIAATLCPRRLEIRDRKTV